MFYPANCSWEWTIKVFITLQYFARKLISWRRENYKSGFKNTLTHGHKKVQLIYFVFSAIGLGPWTKRFTANKFKLEKLQHSLWRRRIHTRMPLQFLLVRDRPSKPWKRGRKNKKASLTKLEAASVFNVLTVYLLSWEHKMDPWELHLFFCSKFGLSLSPFGELWSSPLAPNKWSFLKSYLFFTLNNHLYPIVGNSMNQFWLASLFMTVEFGSVLTLLRIA